MNHNIDKPEGMANAKKWMAETLSLIRDGGVWGIPRAGSIYEIWKSKQLVRRIVGEGDKPTEIVLAEMGWKVEVDQKDVDNSAN